MATRDVQQRDIGTDEEEQTVDAAGEGQPSNTVKDPDQWVTGNESMTGAQASYVKTLADEAGEDVDPDMTKAEASKKIDELQERTGRGINH